MAIVIVKSQAELDALPKAFNEFTIIEIRSTEFISIRENRENSRAVLRGNSSAELWGNSSAELWENSRAVLWGNSRAVLRGNSRAVLWENSRANAFDHSFLMIFYSTVIVKKLLDYATAKFIGVNQSVQFKHDTAQVIECPAEINHTKQSFIDRCDSEKDGTVIVYKSVHKETLCDFYTGKIKYEGVVKCPDFDPNESRQCGGGLHVSPTPGMALSYHPEGKLLKCEVKHEDFVIYATDVTKVRCRELTVLGEV